MNLFQTFIINLDKDAKRLAFMDKQLRSLSIPYTRISAINGKELPETMRRYLPTKEEELDTLNPGEIGCALSHRNIYELIIEKKIPYSLILEDDVILPSSFKEVLEKEIQKNKKAEEWEFLSFDYFAYGVAFFWKLWLPGVRLMIQEENNRQKKVSLFLQILLKGIILIPVVLLEELQTKIFSHSGISPLKQTSFAGAYLLTLKGAEKLIKVHDKILYIADRLPRVAKKKTGLSFKIYTPLIVTQAKDVFISNLHKA